MASPLLPRRVPSGEIPSGRQRERLGLACPPPLERVRQGEGEATADAWGGVQPDAPAVQCDQLTHEWQPQPGAMGAGRRVRLTEPFEYQPRVLRADADAVVAHGDDRLSG